MPERIGQPQDQPTPAPLAPQPNPILAVPATPALCQQDDDQSADVRRVMDQQTARQR